MLPSELYHVTLARSGEQQEAQCEVRLSTDRMALNELSYLGNCPSVESIGRILDPADITRRIGLHVAFLNRPAEHSREIFAAVIGCTGQVLLEVAEPLDLGCGHKG